MMTKSSDAFGFEAIGEERKGLDLSDFTRSPGAPIDRPAAEAAREVADALNYAHAADVLHRDVKPENSLMLAGHAVMLDFGVARAMSASIDEDASADGEAAALDAMDYVVSTMHMQGFSRMFRPVNYAPTEADHDKVKARGKEIMEKGLALMDKALEGKEYLAGKFSVADAALFYVEFWAAGRMKMPLPKNVAAHYARMKARPAVMRVMEQEGIAAAA